MRLLIFLFLWSNISLAQKYYSNEFLDSILTSDLPIKKTSLKQIAQVITAKNKEEFLVYSLLAKWTVNELKYSKKAHGKTINYSLRENLAVCEQYGKIFDSLCKYSGFKSEYIVGFVKMEKSQPSDLGFELHAWNSVNINGKVYMSDLTWADKSNFIKNGKNEIDTLYFLVEPAVFVLTHYPKKKTKTYCKFSRNQFSKLPLLLDDFFELNNYFKIAFTDIKYKGNDKKFKVVVSEDLWQDKQLEGIYLRIDNIIDDESSSSTILEFQKIQNEKGSKIDYLLKLNERIEYTQVARLYLILSDKKGLRSDIPIIVLYR